MGSRRPRRKHESSAGLTAPPPAGDARRRSIWLRAALIVLTGAVAYANALSGPFVLDDQDTVVLNQQIRQLAPSVVLFPALELPVAGRPVVNLSFALNYAAGGLDVRGYHLVNIALHIASALLLFGVVRRTLIWPSLRQRLRERAVDLGFAAALLWLVHPLQTDAVTYVTQRTELMMGLFYLATFYASIRAHEQGHWGLAAVVVCALGMGSKESMVTAPLMVLIYDRIFVFGTFRDAWRRRAGIYVPLAATWLVLVALVWSGPRFRSAGFSTGVSPWTYLLNQTEMIVRYLRLVVWPRGLVVDYGVPRAITAAEAAPYALLLLALAALTVWALVRAPKLGFLGVWFFTTLSPASSVVPIATEVGAERRMYLPLAAVVALAVIGAALLWDRLVTTRPDRPSTGPVRPRVAGYVVLTAITLTLVAGTRARNREFASPVTLARTTLERWPTPRARHSLGVALIAERQYDEAVRHLREAAALDPGAAYSLGLALFQLGQLDEAIVHLRRFLAHESLGVEVPAAHELLGRAHRAQGRFAEAATEFQTALRMTPSRHELRPVLAETLFRQQQFAEAASEYQQFLAVRPDDAGAVMQLGITFVALGRQDDAIVQFRRAVEINPQDAGAHRNLARSLIEKGAYAEAMPSAQQAVALRPDDPVARDQLGVVLAGQGRLDEGIAELRRALQLDPDDNEVRGHLQAALGAKAALTRRP